MAIEVDAPALVNDDASAARARNRLDPDRVGYADVIGHPRRGARSHHEAGGGRRRREPAALDTDDRLAELLCCRLCHDLAGPASAVAIGVGMIGEPDTDDRREAVTIVGAAAEHLVARLSFFRRVFGPAAADETMAVADVVALSARMMASRGITVLPTVPAGIDNPDQQVPMTIGRLALTLSLLAADTLIRGGRLTMNIAAGVGGYGLTLSAKGNGARLADEVRNAVRTVDVAAVSTRSVYAHVAARLLDRAGGQLRMHDAGCGDVTLEVWVPLADRAWVRRPAEQPSVVARLSA